MKWGNYIAIFNIRILKLIIPYSIKKKDFGKIILKNQFEILQKACSKPFANLAGNEITLPKNTKLIKTYGTSPDGAIRIVFLLLMENGNKVLLFYLPKKDKKIGNNITPKNSAFKSELEKRLIQIQQDYQSQNYDIIVMQNEK